MSSDSAKQPGLAELSLDLSTLWSKSNSPEKPEPKLAQLSRPTIEPPSSSSNESDSSSVKSVKQSAGQSVNQHDQSLSRLSASSQIRPACRLTPAAASRTPFRGSIPTVWPYLHEFRVVWKTYSVCPQRLMTTFQLFSLNSNIQ